MSKGPVSGGTVCLTFDFDAISSWIGAGMTSPAAISRGEFGAHAVPRLLRLLATRDIRSTWFVPGHTAETYPDVCRSIASAGHEIGLHGYMHEPPSFLDPGKEGEVLGRSIEAVTNIVGTSPVGYRSPIWDFSSETVDHLVAAGLSYDSSLMGTDHRPYYCRTGDVAHADRAFEFGDPTPLVELPVAWSLDDFVYFEYLVMPGLTLPGLRPPGDVFASFLDDVRFMLRDVNDGVCVITFHPQVIGRGHRLLGLERFIDSLVDLGVTFSRCDEVADNFRDGRDYGRE